VPGNPHPPHPRVEEEEAYDADEGLPLPGVERRAGGHQGDEDFRRHLVVEHREIPPAGGQEGAERGGFHELHLIVGVVSAA
jgi:hypothetical protein